MSRLRIVEATSREGERLLQRLAGRAAEVLDARTRAGAAKLVEAVRRGGDKALLRAVARHDRVRVRRVAELRLAGEAIEPSSSLLPSAFAEALERALAAVERFHRPQVRDGYRLEEGGMVLEHRRTPLRRVGIYVPGGRAAYPSTLLMTVVPARLAGVEQIVVATPRRSWEGSAALRYTLQRLGVEEAWGIGGAHAIAALAHGTETIAAVDKIVGPGNAWVAAAKHLVAGTVAVDGLAGPTEVVVLASGDAPADLVAADLLAQAEHDPRAAALLVTPSKDLAKAVRAAVARQLAALPTAAVAGAALHDFGAALLVDDLEAGAAVVDRIAPEHLQLVGAEAEALAARPFPAGAVFVGASTPEVFGDYVAGPSHVLPTCGTARFASALGVDDFVRRSHLVRCPPNLAGHWAAAAVVWAEAEGLPAHAEAARRRLGS
ncbi:MAG TPA: histidinol dehydrogenase [Thermoanaerobaculia bacterium]|nr:histidinol dehydrogenase [Thermoanaerobaculia bacterium]